VIPYSARNGNLEVPVYFLKAKQGYTVRKMDIDGAGMKFRNKKKFRYGIPVHFERWPRRKMVNQPEQNGL
jgi:hypothetical protein